MGEDMPRLAAVESGDELPTSMVPGSPTERYLATLLRLAEKESNPTIRADILDRIEALLGWLAEDDAGALRLTTEDAGER